MSAFESIGLIILMAYFFAAVILPICWIVVVTKCGLKNGRAFGLIGALIPPVLMGVLTSGFLDVIFNYIFIYSYALSLCLMFISMDNARRDGVSNRLGKVCFILHASGGGVVFAICVIGIALAGDI